MRFFHDIVNWQATAKTMLNFRVCKMRGISLELSDCQILKLMDEAGPAKDEAARVGQKVRVTKTRRYLCLDDLRGHCPCYEL
jgi:hypothetical protein